jgi:hypothetical protein
MSPSPSNGVQLCSYVYLDVAEFHVLVYIACACPVIPLCYIPVRARPNATFHVSLTRLSESARDFLARPHSESERRYAVECAMGGHAQGQGVFGEYAHGAAHGVAHRAAVRSPTAHHCARITLTWL